MRKVQKSWYAETVVGFDKRIEDGTPEFHVDVSRDSGGTWVVSYRRDIMLMTRENSGVGGYDIAVFDRVAGAKSFAIAVAYAYRNDLPLPNPANHEPFAFLSYRFDKDGEWDRVLKEGRGE